MVSDLAADLEALKTLTQALAGFLMELSGLGLILMGFCAWLASKWKQPAASSSTRWLHDWINWLGQNHGEAQNLNDDRRTKRHGDDRRQDKDL